MRVGPTARPRSRPADPVAQRRGGWGQACFLQHWLLLRVPSLCLVLPSLDRSASTVGARTASCKGCPPPPPGGRPYLRHLLIFIFRRQVLLRALWGRGGRAAVRAPGLALGCLSARPDRSTSQVRKEATAPGAKNPSFRLYTEAMLSVLSDGPGSQWLPTAAPSSQPEDPARG